MTKAMLIIKFNLGRSEAKVKVIPCYFT